MKTTLKVMVLAGGPDRERAISLMSGAQVAAALREAGHEVLERDISPDNLAALDDFAAWPGAPGAPGAPGDVLFPILHGSWGEGGGLQRILDDRGVPYVGTSAAAADLCMDKHHTKLALEQAGLPTPTAQLLGMGETLTIPVPLVLKPPREGSSIDLCICHDDAAARAALSDLHQRHHQLLAEAYIAGKELTVSVIGSNDGSGMPLTAMPPIQIVPATAFYDYQAKYFRDDTKYLFAPEIDLPDAVLERCRSLAAAAHRTLGCRHLCRVDFIVDHLNQPWILEVNTLPGFTTHSLLPMAARRHGIEMPALVNLLVRMAIGEE